MKALLCTRIGEPPEIGVQDVPAAPPQGDRVRIKVEAVALNFFDTLMLKGQYQVRPPLPFSPCGECAGTIISSPVETFRPGDRVCAWTGYGAAREEVDCLPQHVCHLPDKVGYEEGAAISIAFGTTLHALDQRARLKAGETLLVLGATGGTGLAAVEMAKLLGARVIASVRGEDKAEFARSHGADETILDTEDLAQRMKELTDGRGADVVYDTTGGDQSLQALRGLAAGGRYLVIGFASGRIPQWPLNRILLKGCDVMGIHWSKAVMQDEDMYRPLISRCLDWVAQGRLRPHIHRIFSFGEITQALSEITGRSVRGKIILKPHPEKWAPLFGPDEAAGNTASSRKGRTAFRTR